jgi:hypothetical protein
MQRKFVNGAMAAQMIGISYKTLKDRFDSGFIVGERTAQGKLKFALDEVERAKKAWQEERSQYISSADLSQPEAPRSDLEDRIADLEVEVKLLHDRLVKLEQTRLILPQQFPPLRDDLKPWGPNVIDAATSSKDTLPEDCVLASKFAETYGISRSTLRWQMDHEKVSYSERPKPGRPKEMERYLTPNQQHGVLAYWRSQGLL